MLDSGIHIQIDIVYIIYRSYTDTIIIPPPYHLECKTYSTTLIKIKIVHVDQSYLSLGQQCHYMYHSTSIVSYQYLCMYCLLVKGNKLGLCNGRIEPHDICTESRKNCENSHQSVLNMWQQSEFPGFRNLGFSLWEIHKFTICHQPIQCMIMGFSKTFQIVT